MRLIRGGFCWQSFPHPLYKTGYPGKTNYLLIGLCSNYESHDMAQLLPVLLAKCIGKTVQCRPACRSVSSVVIKGFPPHVRKIPFSLWFLWCQYTLKHLLLRLSLCITSQHNYKGTKLESPSQSTPNLLSHSLCFPVLPSISGKSWLQQCKGNWTSLFRCSLNIINNIETECFYLARPPVDFFFSVFFFWLLMLNREPKCL